MSATLYLIRHAIAGPAPRGTSDADRRLTAAGASKMHRIALGLKRLGVTPDAVLTSPLRRAEETAEIVVAVLAPDCACHIYPPLAPGHSPIEVASGLQLYKSARQLVLVGHQPDLGACASYLLTRTPGMAALPFKKGAVAAIRVAIIPPHAPGVLQWFLTPKQLRTLARHRR